MKFVQLPKKNLIFLKKKKEKKKKKRIDVAHYGEKLSNSLVSLSLSRRFLLVSSIKHLSALSDRHRNSAPTRGGKGSALASVLSLPDFLHRKQIVHRFQQKAKHIQDSMLGVSTRNCCRRDWWWSPSLEKDLCFPM